MISANGVMTGSYDYGEMARSILIAVAASYAALDLAGRVTAARGRVRAFWLAGGAIAMGIGIWEMHFKGMLAFQLPVSVAYHWPTVLASFGVAVFSSAVALYIVSRRKMGPVQVGFGGLVMGSGIANLHYLNMAAMRLAAVCRFDIRIVILSIVLAIAFSLVALILAFGLRGEIQDAPWRKIAGAIVMGAAISAMHYTGMASATFIASPVIPDLTRTVSITQFANSGVAMITLLVVAAAIVTSSVDRRLAAHAEELELAVIERTRQLNTSNEDLRKEIAERQRAEDALLEAQANLAHVTRGLALGELAASIAHEVNQPLTAVVTNGNFALRQLASGTPNLEKLREAIAEIVEDGTRASAVVSRIRGLFVKGIPNRTELDINEVIQEVTILLRKELSRKRISLRTDLAPDVPPVFGDRVQLQQVLINLVMNGIEAMRLLAHRPRELLIKSARNHNEVLVQVQDSGEGLNPQQKEHVFEPFFTTKSEGIGMGLSISRSIVESHGGRLWAEPAPRGALFQFTLPVP